MKVDLSGNVAIVTGAGTGLGRAHATALARRGAAVVVNDLRREPAEAVCREIEASGGEAMAVAADVADFGQVQRMVDDAHARWGRVDVLVNNAGVLRDRTFAKMDLADFRLSLEVNLMGSVNCTKAVWSGMKERTYGRIVFTTSSSGLYGNFGQSNYSAAKMALVGLMQTLALEGEKSNIRVNCLAPSAATAMTNNLYDADALTDLGPELVAPAVVALASRDAPTRRIILAGAGSFEEAYITMTGGIYLGSGDAAADGLFSGLDQVGRTGETVPANGGVQHLYEVERAMAGSMAEHRR